MPDDPPRRGDSVTVRSIAADRVVLSISVDDPDHQSAAGQFVELTEAGGVRLRPWSIRYSTPAQLDDYARRRRAGVGASLGVVRSALRSTTIRRGTSVVYRRRE